MAEVCVYRYGEFKYEAPDWSLAKTGRKSVSIGHEQTFDIDTTDPAKIANIMLRQSDKIARQLRRRNLRARTLTGP